MSTDLVTTYMTSAHLKQSRYASSDDWHLQFRAASNGEEVTIYLDDPATVDAIKQSDGRAFVTVRDNDNMALEITPNLTDLRF